MQTQQSLPQTTSCISKGGKFVHISGQWYKYLQKDGTYAKDCLMNINGKIYYFSPKGYRQFSWKQIGNDYYYFGTYLEGYMYKLRWLKKPEGTYLLKKSGKRATGWLNYQGHTYYFDKDGIRASGWRIINGKKYYFGTEDQGYKYTGGWLYYKNRIFYMKKDGTPTYGWATISGNRYYFDQNGRAYKGHHKIDCIDYYFSSKGALLYSGPNLSISSDCAVLIDAATGKVIYNKNGNKKHANASTTKIMTYILAVENSPASLNNRVKVSAYAASQEPTKLYMQAGDSFKMKDLLYSLMLGSHNDTAVAIAESVSGSTAKFADKMNTRAKQLGCTSTHFVTPNGLDNGLNHYTTASDLAKIARYAWLHCPFLPEGGRHLLLFIPEHSGALLHHLHNKRPAWYDTRCKRHENRLHQQSRLLFRRCRKGKERKNLHFRHFRRFQQYCQME